MTELETLERAKLYIDKLANGINPLTDEVVPEGEVLNQVRISRCLFYVSKVLNEVIDEKRNPKIRPISSKRSPFSLPAEKRSEYVYSDKPITLSEIIAQLNGMVSADDCKRLTYNHVMNWLVQIGAIEVLSENGNTSKRPTEQGAQFGISVETRRGHSGEYIVNLYNRTAQQMIVDNLDAIVTEDQVTDKSEDSGNSGRPWTKEQDLRLIELFQNHVSTAEIATTLQRSKGGIQARLKRLGLIENRWDAE